MRLLITTDTIGGVWTFTQELVPGLLERHCDVALVSFGREPSAEQKNWSQATAARWCDRFHYESSTVPLEWMQANDGACRDAAPQLMRVAREFGAELLHLNQFCFAALPLSLPKVVTAHSDVLSWADACRNRGLEDSDWLRQYLVLVERGISQAAAIVAPTQWMAKALARHFVLPQAPQVIPNGRSLPKPMERIRKLQAVTVGRLWDEAKDIAMLYDVQSPFPLLVAGEREHDGARMPDAQGHHLRLLGPVRQDDLLALFGQSAIYLCTSRYEPFGLAPLEAALCGCVVLARDIPSLREVWADAALYFTSPVSLSALLHEMADHPALLAKMQEHSWRRAQSFSADRMTKAYLQLFQSLVRHSAAAHVA